MHLPFAGELAALAAALIWAMATMLYARLGNCAPAVILNLLKGALAVAMLVATILILGEPWPDLNPADWLWLAGSGVVGIGIGDSAYFGAIRRIGPNRTLLVECLAPPLTGLLALIVLHEQLTATAWCGVLVTMLGVLWVVTERREHRCVSRTGLACAALAALCQATGMVMSRQVMADTAVTALWAALIRLAAASLVLGLTLPLATRDRALAHRPQGMDWRFWRIFTTAVFLGTFLGIWLQQASLRLTSAAVAQTLLAVSPLCSLVLSRLNGQTISRRSLSGVLIALAGVALFFR